MFKPWRKPFEILLNEMEQHWAARVHRIEQSEPASSRRLPISTFVYSTARLTRHGREFEITVSEFPVTGNTLFESEDNIEYLNVTAIVRETPYDVVMRPMEFLSKLRAMIGLRIGVRTGEAGIDKLYSTWVRGDQSAAVIATPAFRSAVLDCSPFDGFCLNAHTVAHSREIRDKDQLERGAIDLLLKHMAALSDVIEKTLPG